MKASTLLAMKAEVVHVNLARSFTAARARNDGLNRPLERWPEVQLVQFVDGDCEIEAGWTELASAFLREKPAAAAVCGRRRARYPNASFYNGLCNKELDTPSFRLHHAEALRSYGSTLYAASAATIQPSRPGRSRSFVPGCGAEVRASGAWTRR
jgi:hypothetical protein